MKRVSEERRGVASRKWARKMVIVGPRKKRAIEEKNGSVNNENLRMWLLIFER